MVHEKLEDLTLFGKGYIGPDRLVVRTLRCGRNNPGSNPGLDILLP